MTDAATPALPALAPAPAAAAVRNGSSAVDSSGKSALSGTMVASALTVIAPPALAEALAPMPARVVLSTKLSAIAAPTPASFLPMPAAPATVWTPSTLRARTSRAPTAVSVEPDAVVASLVTSTTLTPTEPATPTSLPPPAARPQTMNSSVAPAGVTADTVMELPDTVAPEPTVARLVTIAALTPTAAPMLSASDGSMAVPVAMVARSVPALATSDTLPPAWMMEPPAIVAALLNTSTLTPIAAATPTPLDPELDWSWEVLLPSDALPLAEGRVLSPPLFGLLLTWLSASESELLPPELLPAALAVALMTLMMVAAEVTATLPVLSKLRASVALESSVTTETLTLAPTAASLPAASACVLLSTFAKWTVSTATLPLSALVAPLPRRLVVKLFERVIATAAPTPVSPFAPFSASAFVVWMPVASTVTLRPVPASPTPSSTVATVWLSVRTSATEAPTPTSLPLAPPLAVGFASALLLLVDAASTDRSPPLSVSELPVPMLAVVSTSTRLIETEPATPMSPPPAPDWDVAA